MPYSNHNPANIIFQLCERIDMMKLNEHYYKNTKRRNS